MKELREHSNFGFKHETKVLEDLGCISEKKKNLEGTLEGTFDFETLPFMISGTFQYVMTSATCAWKRSTNPGSVRGAGGKEKGRVEPDQREQLNCFTFTLNTLRQTINKFAIMHVGDKIGKRGRDLYCSSRPLH